MPEYEQTGLAKLLEDFPEKHIQERLSGFSCPRNKEVESFLHRNAIRFSKASYARTYLIFAGDALSGFFTLAPKCLRASDFSQVSNAYAKRIRDFSEHYEDIDSYMASVILVAQIGKNYAVTERTLISGSRLLDFALEKIREIQLDLGGRIVCVECEDAPKLIEFYQSNRFVRFQERANTRHPGNGPEYFVQMIRKV